MREGGGDWPCSDARRRRRLTLAARPAPLSSADGPAPPTYGVAGYSKDGGSEHLSEDDEIEDGEFIAGGSAVEERRPFSPTGSPDSSAALDVGGEILTVGDEFEDGELIDSGRAEVGRKRSCVGVSDCLPSIGAGSNVSLRSAEGAEVGGGGETKPAFANCSTSGLAGHRSADAGAAASSGVIDPVPASCSTFGQAGRAVDGVDVGFAGDPRGVVLGLDEFGTISQGSCGVVDGGRGDVEAACNVLAGGDLDDTLHPLVKGPREKVQVGNKSWTTAPEAGLNEGALLDTHLSLGAETPPTSGMDIALPVSPENVYSTDQLADSLEPASGFHKKCDGTVMLAINKFSDGKTLRVEGQASSSTEMGFKQTMDGAEPHGICSSPTMEINNGRMEGLGLESGASKQMIGTKIAGTGAADENMTVKAMKRASVRNLDGHVNDKIMKEHLTPPLNGYLCGGILAFDMGYPATGGIASMGCQGIATFGEGGQGIFYPSAWVAV